MQRWRNHMRTVFYSMLSTWLTLALIMGFIVVEKNTRRIGFADNNPWFVYRDSPNDGHYIKIRFMNKPQIIDFSCIYDITDEISQNVSQAVETLQNMAKNI